MLRIFNSHSGVLETFEPLNPPHLGIYVCGITVYDRCHLGHARSFVAFDAIVRYLRFCGHQVNYVRNITDIDDKMIAAAVQNGEPVAELAQRMIDLMDRDLLRLGLAVPDMEPRATGHISQMIDMIGRLIASDHAYLSDGDVYFSVRSDPEYGSLSRRGLDAMQPEEPDAAYRKRDPLDFALWKAEKPGEPAWDSPWGRGRPGWHIECSAMSEHHLGESFDIHGGGVDLKFPHHENEIAQSRCGSSGEFARIWMHTGPLQASDGEKMSKSLGNQTVLSDVLDAHPAEAVYLFLLGAHYRSPMEYSDALIAESVRGLRRLYSALRTAPPGGSVIPDEVARFRTVMDDDFNTAEARSVLFDLARQINRERGGGKTRRAADLAATLRHLGGVFGLLGDDPEDFLQRGAAGESLDEAAIRGLIAERTNARSEGDFARADAIRDQLAAQGVVLLDSVEGTRWERV